MIGLLIDLSRQFLIPGRVGKGEFRACGQPHDFVMTRGERLLAEGEAATSTGRGIIQKGMMIRQPRRGSDLEDRPQ